MRPSLGFTDTAPLALIELFSCLLMLYGLRKTATPISGGQAVGTGLLPSGFALHENVWLEVSVLSKLHSGPLFNFKPQGLFSCGPLGINALI